MKREFLQGLRVGEQPLPEEIIDAILEQNGQDIQKAGQGAQDWQDKYERAVRDHSAELTQLRLQTSLETAVSRAGGRSVKAIGALLDMDAIAGSEDVPAALDAALAELKKDNGYLFEAPTPPAYARFTGSGGEDRPASPATLAGALRERMERR